jgi:eukaryotic-like serine/threonine-protein kinase
VSDHPAGVFNVPVLGGAERLVLESGQAPDTLPDGTIIVVGLENGGDFQFARFRPEDPKPVPFGPRIVREFAGLTYRPLPDGKRILFYGGVHDSAAPQSSPRRAYLLDIASGKAEPFAPSLPLVPPLTVSTDGRRVFAALRTGDMVQIVRIALSGEEIEPLLSLSGGVTYIWETAETSSSACSTAPARFCGSRRKEGTRRRWPATPRAR